ncbi:MAG: hypothetical protein K2X11_08825 [Acetobacteraceae bacterium]|nr:hypothetical protein [Acetobacteraceae bacterium]
MKITADALRTFRNATLVGAMLVSGLAAYASTNGNPPPVRMPNEAARHMAGGVMAAEQRLGRELAAHHPVGSDANSLLSRLSREGFECMPDLARPGSYECVFVRPLAFSRVARLETRVDTDGLRVTGLRPAVIVQPAPATL